MATILAYSVHSINSENSRPADVQSLALSVLSKAVSLAELENRHKTNVVLSLNLIIPPYIFSKNTLFPKEKRRKNIFLK